MLLNGRARSPLDGGMDKWPLQSISTAAIQRFNVASRQQQTLEALKDDAFITNPLCQSDSLRLLATRDAFHIPILTHHALKNGNHA